jgi:DNA-binding NarL/FixJ family response regulator
MKAMVAKRRRGVDVFGIRVADEELVVVSLPVGQPIEQLTRAEAEVANDAIAGLSNTAIARRRRRSPRTIANQLGAIYRKLGVASRAELAAKLFDER